MRYLGGMETTETVRKATQAIVNSKLYRAEHKLTEALKELESALDANRTFMLGDMAADYDRERLATWAGYIEGTRDLIRDMRENA